MGIKQEHELILKLVNFRNPDKDRIIELLRSRLDWAEVLGQLSYNRVAGLAYHVLQECKLPKRTINREFYFGLYTHYEFQALRTQASRAIIREVSEALGQTGIPYAFLKGSILASSIYPTGCRVSNDIDILVRAKDLTVCNEALKKAGYIQGFFNMESNTIVQATRQQIINRRMNTGEIIPFLKMVNAPGINISIIDTNFSIDWLPDGSDDVVDAFLENTDFYDIGEGAIAMSLSKECFLAHLCVHLYKEACVLKWVLDQRDLSLYKFVDIYGFITEHQGANVKWDKFVEIARSNKIEKECYYALEYTYIFFPELKNCPGFERALQGLMPTDVSYLDEIIVPDQPDIKYLWEKDLLSRFFDMKRFESLKKIQDENSNYTEECTEKK